MRKVRAKGIAGIRVELERREDAIPRLLHAQIQPSGAGEERDGAAFDHSAVMLPKRSDDNESLAPLPSDHVSASFKRWGAFAALVGELPLRTIALVRARKLADFGGP